MQLRRGGIRRPILILGYTPPAYARDLVAMGLRQEVHSLEYARALHEELKLSLIHILKTFAPLPA